MVYLLHFDRKIYHAQHYLGFTDDFEQRIKRHRGGYSGSVLVTRFHELGIKFQVARTWPDKGREFERYLKKVSKHHTRLCPICKEEKTHA